MRTGIGDVPNSKYPNLVAEYRYGSCDITTWADYANVTVDVMKAVLRGEDDLIAPEELGIVNLLRRYGPIGEELEFMEYLFAGEPLYVELDDTLKTELKDKWLTCERIIGDMGNSVDLWYMECLQEMREARIIMYGETLTDYALIRNYCGRAEEIIRMSERQPKRKNRLTEEIVELDSIK